MTRRVDRLVLAVLASLGAWSSTALAQGHHAVHTPDGTAVWAVGDAGVAYFSTDAGLTYSNRSPGSAGLRAVVSRGSTVLIAGTGGKIYHSTNAGGAWSEHTIAGTPELKAVELANPSTGWLAGDAGTIQKTTDGGATWTAQTSGVGVMLHALKFTDDQSGWAVGDAGTVLRTTDGGDTWNPVALATTQRLRTVDQNGSRVWIGGDGGACQRSTDGGANWTGVNLKLDSRSDVRAVRLGGGDSVLVAGGGGFVRRSVDGGITWTFFQHTLHSRLTGLAVHGSRLFMCSDRHRVVFRSTNSGTTWSMPPTASHSKFFTNKQAQFGPTRGSTITQNPFNPRSFFAVSGNRVLKSWNEGDNWTVVDTIPLSTNRTNAFTVSTKDTNIWVAACKPGTGSGRVMRTTDAGANWGIVLGMDYGEYGIPLERHPDRPDTLIYGPSNSPLYHSTNFGATWTVLTSDSNFRSPCDIVVVPGNSDIVLVGDGVTGNVNPPCQFYRSEDGGGKFDLMYSGPSGQNASEIPGMACSRLNNAVTIGTHWSGGGLMRTTNSGVNWSQVNNAGSAWGADISRDDPNVMMFAQYSGSNCFISTDGGNSWASTTLTGTSNGLFARDRELILAEQGDGIWKLNYTYNYTPSSGSQAINVNVPNGGEEWTGGSVRNIVWSHANLALVRIEYRKSPADPWQQVAEVPGYQGTYAWTVPLDVTYEASIRISDAWDGSPADQSDGQFIIQVPQVNATPPLLDFGDHAKGSVTTLPVTVDNFGSGALILSAVNATGDAFTDGRTTFTIPASGSDTIGVSFRPAAGVFYEGTLVFDTNDPATPQITIVLIGNGLSPMFAALPDPLDLGAINPGATRKDTMRIENAGNVPLTISNITISNADFYVSRTSLIVPAGSSDTVRVFYHPLEAGLDTATFTFDADDTTAAHAVTIYGEARANVATGDAPPVAFALFQNQPNPFGGATQLRYALPVATEVALEVFDLGGQRVATLVRTWQEPGRYSVPFGPAARGADGRSLAGLHSGVYFYRLSAGGFTTTRKMLFVR